MDHKIYGMWKQKQSCIDASKKFSVDKNEGGEKVLGKLVSDDCKRGAGEFTR